MKIIAVTTFNKAGFDLYGKRLIETFYKHWCCGACLKVYAEGWVPEQNYDIVEYADLDSSAPWLLEFRQKYRSRNSARNGYRYDAIRFSFKVGAMLAAAKDPYLDYLIWLDGDIITHADFDNKDLETLLPEKNELLSWLDRSDMYPELGFYILNCRHSCYEKFCEEYQLAYTTGRLFDMEEWHDCWVAKEIVKELKAETKSLSGVNGFHTHHPLVHGPLGKWFDHAKGPRKNRKNGRTPKGEVQGRTEPYWVN